MTSTTDRARAAMMGAAVADAATMGFHWLYDQARIAEVAGDEPEFRSPNKADFQDKGYFAHGGKTPGEASHYGAQMMAMATAILAKSYWHVLCLQLLPADAAAVAVAAAHDKMASLVMLPLVLPLPTIKCPRLCSTP